MPCGAEDNETEHRRDGLHLPAASFEVWKTDHFFSHEGTKATKVLFAVHPLSFIIDFWTLAIDLSNFAQHQ
jgi:hypothetical protein